MLCEEHAVVGRVAAEPEYLEWLKREVARLEERVDDITSAIILQDRIEDGLKKIKAGEVDAAKGAAFIGTLEEAKAEEDRGLDNESLLFRLQESELSMIYWQRQLSRTTQTIPL